MAFSPVLNLSDLDGNNGVVINISGATVSNAGDLNGDGIDDVIIGASGANPDGNSSAGESYVVFGGQNLENGIDISDLDGNNGFILTGIDAFDQSGQSVSLAGDLNGDGFDDVIIGALTADPNGNYSAGESYVIFGGPDFNSRLNLSTLNGDNGFVISGINEFDRAGSSVSNAGDTNGDGFDDVIIGAPGASVYSGESYVIFGGQNFGATLSLSDLDSGTGFVINGFASYDAVSVSTAGDLNGDGIDDVIIGIPGFRNIGNYAEGTSYVVFGGQDLGNSLDLFNLNGSNGFVINGIDIYDRAGSSVSNAGDINGDGFDDVIIGSPGDYYTGPFGSNSGPESYVVFGGQNFDRSLNLSALNGENGFVIDGIDQFDRTGVSVSNAGDMNGDGIADIIIGASGGDPDNVNNAGESYVVFGGQDFSNRLDLLTLNGDNGFVINGIDSGDYSGSSVSTAGDFNGDGIDDVIINGANESYVVFGRPLDAPSLLTNRVLSVAENTPFIIDIETVDNLDSDGDGLTYSLIGGADQNLFTIKASTGELSLNIVPDFEKPDDSNQDNAYEVEVKVIDSDGFSDIGLFSVRINNTDIEAVNLSELNGDNGFVINGIDDNDRAGSSVSNAGDINGDGFDDLIIGAYRANPSNFYYFITSYSFEVFTYYTGESYVVFGGPDFDSSLELSELNGSNGFVVNGVAVGDESGRSVSNAGDINGDGFDDVLIAAPGTSSYVDNTIGETYVVFGGSDFDSSLELSDLDGSNGFVINGADVYDDFGISVSAAGDINGDGVDDVIIGARNANPNGNFGAGESYVVFGGQSFDGSLDLLTLDGSNGLVINGIDGGDQSGTSVSVAGDINGDGIDDVIIGARYSDPNDNNLAGETYVVFGSQAFGSSLDLSELDGGNGFVINGIDPYDRSGRSVSNAGDINGDGIDDVIIGARYGDPNGISRAGESYVIFGRQAFDSSLELSELDGDNGFVINGVNEDDRAGRLVSAAGDFNGDGIDDLLIGAPGSDAGENYVVFGGQDFGGSLELSALDGSNGFVINGLASSSVSTAGDINDDGFDDLIIGGGPSYVVFGRSFTPPSFDNNTAFTVTEPITFVGDLEATDVTDTEEDGLIYRITNGVDQSLFTIDSITGELSFTTAPDFEQPGDSNSDNIYEVEVSITNGIDLSDNQLLTITVVDDTGNIGNPTQLTDTGWEKNSTVLGVWNSQANSVVDLEDGIELAANVVANTSNGQDAITGAVDSGTGILLLGSLSMGRAVDLVSGSVNGSGNNNTGLALGNEAALATGAGREIVEGIVSITGGGDINIGIDNNGTVSTGGSTDTVSGTVSIDTGNANVGLLNGGTLKTEGGNDDVFGQISVTGVGIDNIGLDNSGLINTGAASDSIEGQVLGDGIGIRNTGIITTGNGKDELLGSVSGLGFGIDNSGLIELGVNIDIVSATGDDAFSGFTGGGTLNLGGANDIISGFGDQFVDGGGGTSDTAIFEFGFDNSISLGSMGNKAIDITANGITMSFVRVEQFQFTNATYTLHELRALV